MNQSRKSVAIATLTWGLTVGCETSAPLSYELSGMACENIEDCAANCGRLDVNACRAAGLAYLGSPDVTADPRRAAWAYGIACDLSHSESCAQAGEALLSLKDSAADRAALDYLINGCDAGNAHSCAQLGASHGRGAGVPADEELAARHYGRACDLGAGVACRRLGLMVRLGKVGKPDAARARILFERACTQHDPEGCELAKEPS